MAIEKQNLIKQFSVKILGVRNYASEQKKFMVSDFIDLTKLDRVLGEVSTGESDITPAGKAFVYNYYDLGELAEKLFNENNKYLFNEISAKSPKDIKEWLLDLEPMVAIAFIEEVRGNITGKGTLKGELLPPEGFNET